FSKSLCASEISNSLTVRNLVSSDALARRDWIRKAGGKFWPRMEHGLNTDGGGQRWGFALPVLRTVHVRSCCRAVAPCLFHPCSIRVSSVAQHSALVRTSSSLPLRSSENPKPFPREGGTNVSR